MTTEKQHSLPPFVIVLIGLSVLGLGFKLIPALLNRSSISNLGDSISLEKEKLIEHVSPNLGDSISTGEEQLIKLVSSPHKISGIEAYRTGDYQTAISHFERSLQQQRNDPETLVYLNNAQAATQTPLTVAISLPISSNINVSQEMLRGAAHAQDQINRQGGINGHSLQLTIVDDHNDPAYALDLAQTLANDDNILAVIGHNTSDVSLAVAPTYQSQGLVMVSPTSTANNLSNFGTHIFRTLPTVQAMTQRLAVQATDSGSHNMAVCYDSQATAAVTFKEEFAIAIAQAGGRVVPTICDLSSPSFTVQDAIDQALANEADGLLIAPHIDRIDRALSLAHRNQQQLPLWGSPALYTMQTLEQGRTAIDEMVLPAIWHPQLAPEFSQAALNYWGGPVNWRTATTYDAMSAIATALSSGATRDTLHAVLRDQGFESKGTHTLFRFLPSGDIDKQPILLEVQTDQPINKTFRVL
ncbi:MAG: ABC transporter substrate-binding protein [Cyanobacteria bacterium P01_F01_bin.13]